jgi:hypothetical protein
VSGGRTLASPKIPLADAAFGSGDAARKGRRRAEEKIELQWLWRGTIFPSSMPQGVEEVGAKAHQLEFVRRLEAGSTDGVLPSVG